MPKESIDLATASLEKGCKVITDLRFGLGLLAAEGTLAVLSGGSSAEASSLLKVGFNKLVVNVSERIAEKGIIKAGTSFLIHDVAKAGGKFIIRTGLLVGGTLVATDFAKAAVLKHANFDTSGLATDEAFANQVDMGGNLFAQDTNRKLTYGRPMICSELVQSKADDMAYIKQQNDFKSISERYFAITNPSSLLTRSATTASNMLGNPTSLTSNILTLFGKFASTFTSIGLNLFGGKAHALSTIPCTGSGDYNIVQWGWSPEEEAIVANDENYSPLMNELILSDEDFASVEKEYGKCYTSSMGTILADGDIRREDDGSVIVDQGDCSPNNLGIRNAKYGDKVFRWRLKHRYDNTLQHLEDIQNADLSI